MSRQSEIATQSAGSKRFEPGPRVSMPVFLIGVFFAVSINTDLLLYFEADLELRVTVITFAVMKYGLVLLAWIIAVLAGKIARRVRDTQD